MSKYIYDKDGKYVGEITDEKRNEYQGNWSGCLAFVVYGLIVFLPIFIWNYTGENDVVSFISTFSSILIGRFLYKKITSDKKNIIQDFFESINRIQNRE